MVCERRGPQQVRKESGSAAPARLLGSRAAGSSPGAGLLRVVQGVRWEWHGQPLHAGRDEKGRGDEVRGWAALTWNDRGTWATQTEPWACAPPRALVGHGLTFRRDPIFVRASGQTAVMWVKPGYVAGSITPRGGTLALFLFCSRGI